MRRYLETLFRYWYIALLPVILLPAASFAFAKSSTTTTNVRASVWASQGSVAQLGYVNSYDTPAANVARTLNQLLQTRNFDMAVAKQSPIFFAPLAPLHNRVHRVQAEISQNVTATATGPNIVTLNYATTDPRIGRELMNAVLSQAALKIRDLALAQNAKSTAYFTGQLAITRAALSQADQNLAAYVTRQHIGADKVLSQQYADPTLAVLYQAVQSAGAAVSANQGELSKLNTAKTAGSAFAVLDRPYAQSASQMKRDLLMTFAALFIGLILSFLFIAARTASDRSVRRASEVGPMLGLPALASIPFNKSRAQAYDRVPQPKPAPKPAGVPAVDPERGVSGGIPARGE